MTACVCLSRFGSRILALWLSLFLIASVSLSIPSSATTIEVFYAPEDAPMDRVVALYNRAHRYLYVAVYGLSYPRAVEALVAAKKRGIDVRVLTDRERLDDPKQRAAVNTLRLAGIPIRVNQHDGLMHMKQVVMDDEVNASGSMNHTTSGNRYNDERLDVITDKAITARAREKFLAMWNDHERYQPWSEGR
jgi:phosphatidylserine/phosphatidylglycerophosphate/cardiolipin synthase-like enzyme